MQVRFLRDGKRALSGSWDQTIRLWDVASSKELKKLREGRGAWGGFKVTSIDVSPDGKLALVAGEDDLVELWDLEAGAEVSSREGGHSGAVHSLSISADGKRVLSASADRSARIWDAANGAELGGLMAPEGFDRAALSPDAKRAVTHAGSTLACWDVSSSSQGAVLGSTSCELALALAVSPDGAHATVCEGSAIRVFTLPAAPGKPLELERSIQLERSFYDSAALSSDGTWALSLIIQVGAVTDLANSKSERRLCPENKAVPGRTTCVALVPGTRQAVLGFHDGSLLLADLTGSEGDSHMRRLGDLAPHGRCRVRELCHEQQVNAVAVSADGKLAASAGHDGLVRLWDLEAARTKPTEGARDPLETIDLGLALGEAESLVFAPDGSFLLAGTARGLVLRFDLTAR
jgi:WD40 repeat protein